MPRLTELRRLTCDDCALCGERIKWGQMCRNSSSEWFLTIKATTISRCMWSSHARATAHVVVGRGSAQVSILIGFETRNRYLPRSGEESKSTLLLRSAVSRPKALTLAMTTEIAASGSQTRPESFSSAVSMSPSYQHVAIHSARNAFRYFRVFQQRFDDA